VSAHEPPSPDSTARSTRSLLGSVKDNVQGLIAHELAAAKQELIDGVKQQVSGVAMLLIAALMSLPFILFLGTAAALALATVLPAWLAWLILSGILLLLVLLLLLVGKKRFTTTVHATQTIAETKAAFTQVSRAVSRPETDT